MKEFIEVPATIRSLAFRRLVCGVGTNDAKYMVRQKLDGKILICHFYQTWQNMIKRCYCEKIQGKRPTYIGCSVSNNWLTFSNFRLWMEGQDWKGKQIDKDILVVGNKIYSEETCIFVSGAINCLLTGNKNKGCEDPQGVSWHSASGKYISQCRVNGNNKYLGIFSTSQEAELAYLLFKSITIKKVAFDVEASSNKKLQLGLRRHAEIFSIKAESIKLQLSEIK